MHCDGHGVSTFIFARPSSYNSWHFAFVSSSMRSPFDTYNRQSRRCIQNASSTHQRRSTHLVCQNSFTHSLFAILSLLVCFQILQVTCFIERTINISPARKFWPDSINKALQNRCTSPGVIVRPPPYASEMLFGRGNIPHVDTWPLYFTMM